MREKEREGGKEERRKKKKEGRKEEKKGKERKEERCHLRETPSLPLSLSLCLSLHWPKVVYLPTYLPTYMDKEA